MSPWRTILSWDVVPDHPGIGDTVFMYGFEALHRALSDMTAWALENEETVVTNIEPEDRWFANAAWHGNLWVKHPTMDDEAPIPLSHWKEFMQWPDEVTASLKLSWDVVPDSPFNKYDIVRFIDPTRAYVQNIIGVTGRWADDNEFEVIRVNRMDDRYAPGEIAIVPLGWAGPDEDVPPVWVVRPWDYGLLELKNE